MQNLCTQSQHSGENALTCRTFAFIFQHFEIYDYVNNKKTFKPMKYCKSMKKPGQCRNRPPHPTPPHPPLDNFRDFLSLYGLIDT